MFIIPREQHELCPDHRAALLLMCEETCAMSDHVSREKLHVASLPVFLIKLPLKRPRAAVKAACPQTAEQPTQLMNIQPDFSPLVSDRPVGVTHIHLHFPPTIRHVLQGLIGS